MQGGDMVEIVEQGFNFLGGQKVWFVFVWYYLIIFKDL